MARFFPLTFFAWPLLAVITSAEEIKDQLPSPPIGKAWKLVWHDEFCGDNLDESKWTYRPDGKRKSGWWSRKRVARDFNRRQSVQRMTSGSWTFRASPISP